MWGNMGEGEMEDDRVIVKVVEGVRNLGGREILSCMRAGILVWWCWW